MVEGLLVTVCVLLVFVVILLKWCDSTLFAIYKELLRLNTK